MRIVPFTAKRGGYIPSCGHTVPFGVPYENYLDYRRLVKSSDNGKEQTMKSVERVKAAFNYQKTDRIPRYEIFLPEFTERFYEKSGLPGEISIYDYYDKIDIGAILADQGGPFSRGQKIERRDGKAYYERDSWGRLLLKKDNAYFEQEIESAFKDKNKADSIVFESPLPEARYENLRLYSEAVKKRFAAVSGVLGLYMGCWRLRGQERLLGDMAEDKEFCRYLIGRLADFTREVGLKTAEMSDTLDTALWVYDEFSSQRGPMFSPKTFEDLFLPAYRKMIGYWKSKGVKNVVLHCDGNSLPLLDMIIEAGFTGVQGFAPSAGMRIPDVKKKYGNRLVMIGGMCNVRTLASGTFAEIKREAEEIAEAAKDGGVMIGTHSVDADIPACNYDYYYSVVNRIDQGW